MDDRGAKSKRWRIINGTAAQRCLELNKMEQMAKEEFRATLVEMIRNDPDVYKALLDWAAFNPHIKFEW